MAGVVARAGADPLVGEAALLRGRLDGLHALVVEHTTGAQSLMTSIRCPQRWDSAAPATGLRNSASRLSIVAASGWRISMVKVMWSGTVLGDTGSGANIARVKRTCGV